MEVHSHSHSSRKKWYHYFWEFFMLFLAVTLGFFVENQREHLVERKREKQFMVSLLNDLKTDTAAFNQAKTTYINSSKQIDSLIGLLKNPERNKWTGRIYFLAKWVVFDTPFHAVDKTYEQMKSSGNLRLVHNTSLLDSLGLYYYKFNNDEKFGPPHMQFETRHDLFMSYDKLFDASVFQKMILPLDSVTAGRSSIIMPEDNPPLLTNDPFIINEICMRFHNLYFVRRVIIRLAGRYLKTATWLIKKIEEEYHLK